MTARFRALKDRSLAAFAAGITTRMPTSYGFAAIIYFGGGGGGGGDEAYLADYFYSTSLTGYHRITLVPF